MVGLLTISISAIMSPQILELSGIGDAEVLKKAGIETAVDLPGVGNNVQEHVYSGASYGEYDYRNEPMWL
jgi:choline dehydrogenase-like flavoprotein